MDIYKSRDFSYSEKLDFFKEEVRDTLLHTDTRGVDRNRREEFSNKAASIVAGITNSGDRQKAIATLNDDLDSLGAARLDLSGSVQRTASKVASQAPMIDPSCHKRSETPPPSYFDARLEDFLEACEQENREVIHEILEEFKPGSQERLQLEALKSELMSRASSSQVSSSASSSRSIPLVNENKNLLAEVEQIAFETKALLMTQAPVLISLEAPSVLQRGKEIDQAKVVKKAQKLLDGVSDDIQDEIFIKLFICLRPAGLENRIHHPKGDRHVKDLLGRSPFGLVSIASWDLKVKELATIYNRLDADQKEDRKWELNELAKFAKDLDQVEKDGDTFKQDVNLSIPEEFLIEDRREYLNLIHKSLWEEIRARWKVEVGRDLNQEDRKKILTQGRFPFLIDS